MLKKFRKNLLQFVLIIFFLYFFVLVFLYFYQRNLLYHPNENNYSGDIISVDIKKVKIRTSDNIEFFMWVIFAAISPGIIAFTLYTMAQKKLGASLTGFTLYIFTIYGAIYGYFLFEEKLENYHLVGTVLVFIGVYLAKKKDVQKI